MIDKNVLDQQGLGLSLFADSMAQVPCLRQKKCFRSHAWIRVNGQCGFLRWRFAAVLCKAAKLVSRGSPSLFLQLLSTCGAFSQGGRGRKWPAFWAPFSRDPLRAVYSAGFAPCWEHDGGGRHGGSLWPFREGTARCGQTGPVPFVGVVKKIPGGKWTPDLEVCVWGSGAAMFM